MRIITISALVVYVLGICMLIGTVYYLFSVIADVGLQTIVKNIWCGSKGC